MHRRLRIAGRLALAMLGGIAGVALLEATVRGLRLADFDRLHPEPRAAVLRLGEILFDPDATLMYRPARSAHVREPWYGFTYDTTALGWRVTALGAGEHVAKPVGVKRVVCLGDSCTFGLRVVNSDTYSAKLGQSLGVGYEVWNLGVPGYTSAHGVRLLDYLTMLAPDVVVLAFGFNDSYLSQVSAAQDFATLDRAPWRWSWRNVVARSQLLRFLYHAVGKTHPRFESVAPESRWQTRVAPAQYDANMRTIVARVHAMGARPLLIDLDLPNCYVRSALERLAADTGTPLLRAREILAQAITDFAWPRRDDAVASGRVRITIGRSEAPPFLVAIPLDRTVLVPRNLAFERAASGGWQLEVPASPEGWEWTITTKPPNNTRELTQLANFATFIPSLSANDAGRTLHLEELPFAPYRSLLADDPIHPNAAGQELLARALVPLVTTP